MHSRTLVLALAGLVAISALAQTTPKQPSPPPEPKAARPEDVDSPEALLNAVYDTISGPSGKKRDWDRMRSLFLPDAKMAATAKRPDGTVIRRSFTVEEYIERNSKPMEEGGFFENGIHHHVDRYGQMAQAFSAYESRKELSDKEPLARGINCFQLWSDGKRWWISNLIWEGESPGNPIPEKFLKGG